MHQEIVDYIIQAQKHGLTETDIKQNLLNVGWEAAAVEDAFAYAKAFENKPQAVKASDSFISHDKGKGPNSSVLYPAVISHDNINISEQHFTAATDGSKKSSWKMGLLFALLVLIALAGGAYGYYSYVYLSPQRILNKYLDTRTKADSLNTNYTLSYTDKGPKSDTDPTPQEITFGLSGNGYADSREENNTKSDIITKLFMKTSGQEASTEIEIISLGKIFYLKIPDIQLLKEALPDPSISWIKLDSDSIEKYINEQLPPGTASSTNSLSSNLELRNKIIKIWRDAKILTPGSKAVREVIDQTPVFRLEPSIDSEKLTEAVINSINTIQSYQGSSNLKLTDDQKKAIAALVEKFKVKNLKLWIGQKDYKLYKIQAQIAAPSIKDAGSTNAGDYVPALSSARAKSRDAKRLADVRQLATALELFANDNHGNYPDAQNGTPLNLSPYYIGEIPTAPTPTDGTCTDYYNTYWYMPTGKPTVYNNKNVYPDYELTFCLGGNTGGYRSGIAKLSKNGIQASLECPSTKENCEKSTAAESEQTLEEIKKMDFSAEISYEATFKDYGINKELVAPQNALDIIDLITGALGQAKSESSDAKRLADMRQLASALELYFNDYNSYPESLSKMAPMYIGVIPTAPTPPGGACADQDNNYTYKYLNPNNYQLTFCLGSNTGGFAAGKHTLTEAGISN